MTATPTIDFSKKPVLNGSAVTLRPVTVADVPALGTALGDAELAMLTGSVHSLTEVGTERWSEAELESIYRRWIDASDRIVWAIVENVSGAVVGESVLNELDVANRSCGFRIWISGARDRGLGTEATRLTMRHAFEDQGLNRVELEVYDFNPRARRVYEKVGFVHEGTRRQALRFENAWIDAHDMSILACEWADHRGHATS